MTIFTNKQMNDLLAIHERLLNEVVEVKAAINALHNENTQIKKGRVIRRTDDVVYEEEKARSKAPKS